MIYCVSVVIVFPIKDPRMIYCVSVVIVFPIKEVSGILWFRHRRHHRLRRIFCCQHNNFLRTWTTFFKLDTLIGHPNISDEFDNWLCRPIQNGHRRPFEIKSCVFSLICNNCSILCDCSKIWHRGAVSEATYNILSMTQQTPNLRHFLYLPNPWNAISPWLIVWWF